MPTYIKTGFWEKAKKGYKEWLNLDQLIESKITPPTYKVYTALLTQSGGDVPGTVLGYGDIDKGWTYTIVANPDNYDLTIYGAPNNNVSTSFVANQNAILPYTSSLELSYNEGAPVATVLENTIGNIWFEYGSVYSLKSNGLFTQNKTYFNITETVEINGPNNTRFSMFNYDTSTISIVSYDPIADNYVNGALLNTPIEIRVYN